MHFHNYLFSSSAHVKTAGSLGTLDRNQWRGNKQANTTVQIPEELLVLLLWHVA
jgi:hypothetical protein